MFSARSSDISALCNFFRGKFFKNIFPDFAFPPFLVRGKRFLSLKRGADLRRSRLVCFILCICLQPSARRKASKYRTKTSRFNLFLDTVVDANSPLKEQISSQESSGSTDEILTSKATAEDTEVDQGGVLLTVVTGDAVQKLQNMQETEIVEEAYQTLSKLFPEQVCFRSRKKISTTYAIVLFSHDLSMKISQKLSI